MEITGKYAASTFIVQQGIVVDFGKKCFKKFNRLFYLFTFWQKCVALPKVEYVLMFKTLYAKCEPCNEEDFNNSATIQLSLVYNKNRRLIVHESENMREIKELAYQLARYLGANIRDSATDRRNPKWIRNAAIPANIN